MHTLARTCGNMTPKLQAMIEAARQVRMSPEERDEQRISFALGNTSYENPSITREVVVQAARLATGKCLGKLRES